MWKKVNLHFTKQQQQFLYIENKSMEVHMYILLLSWRRWYGLLSRLQLALL